MPDAYLCVRGFEGFAGATKYALGQPTQRVAQVDQVLHAGAEQVVGMGGRAVGVNGTPAHGMARNCKKPAVSVAKTGRADTSFRC